MERKGISQEGLKVLACLTMLIDHIGAALVPVWGLRIVGRIAFPIFCFLMAEGAHYTRNPRRYALRLFVGMLLSELPFDYALFGGPTWRYQSVMVTMLLGYLAVWAMGRTKKFGWKLLIGIPFVLAAEALRTDYGGHGVLFILLFAVTRELPRRGLWQTMGLALLSWHMNSYPIPVGPVRVPIELFAVLAMLPISLYQGSKRTHSRTIQWAFYLFYPVHLAVIALMA